MSATLATVADALIEFILSLLRDPAAQAEFDQNPERALASHGLSSATAADVCAVAPVVIEREHVVPAAQPQIQRVVVQNNDPSDHVIREIKNVTNQFSWVDDRDTIVDQSVNQNIWAKGDVTQHFDNQAVVASGDSAIAAGDGVDIQTTLDKSTNITAGDDANVGNTTTTTAVDGSYNDATETTTTTDNSTNTVVEDSYNDSSTTDTADDSYNDSAAQYTETQTEVDSTTVYDSTDVTVIDDTPADDGL